MDVTACVDLRDREEDYAYLLGLYLGDGCLSKSPKDVWRLRISQDARYSKLIASCVEAIRRVSGKSAGRIPRPGCFEIYAYWKHWACVFPQHGPGRKHERRIVLEPWQQLLLHAHPEALLRGLIHSDGCRALNRVRRPSGEGYRSYAYPRYYFTNASADIRALFSDTCDQLGIRWRVMTERVISVARRADVARLDAFIEPKH